MIPDYTDHKFLESLWNFSISFHPHTVYYVQCVLMGFIWLLCIVKHIPVHQQKYWSKLLPVRCQNSICTLVAITWYGKKYVSHYTPPSLSKHKTMSTMVIRKNCEHFQYSDIGASIWNLAGGRANGRGTLQKLI